jgi:hypothetical protein
MGDRKHNQHFSQLSVSRILGSADHPLGFLVDRHTRWWQATRHGTEVPAVQIGHLESLHSGAAERLGLEDADFNQLSNWKGERHGAVFHKSCVLIGGVHVEERTARSWESAGLLKKGTVATAPASAGWMPGWR